MRSRVSAFARDAENDEAHTQPSGHASGLPVPSYGLTVYVTGQDVPQVESTSSNLTLAAHDQWGDN